MRIPRGRADARAHTVLLAEANVPTRAVTTWNGYQLPVPETDVVCWWLTGATTLVNPGRKMMRGSREFYGMPLSLEVEKARVVDFVCQ